MPRLQINCHLMRTAMCGILRRNPPRREQMPHSSTRCTWPYERPRHSTTNGMQQHDAPKLLEPIAHHHGMRRAGTGPAHRRPSFALSSPRATRPAALRPRGVTPNGTAGFGTVRWRQPCLRVPLLYAAVLVKVTTSRNSQGAVPSRDGVQHAYLCLWAMIHARNPTRTENTPHVHRAPLILIRTAGAVTYG